MNRAAAPLLLAIIACSSQPTLLVTNATGRPLEVYAYDYSVSNNPGYPPGIYINTPSPRFTLGRVNSGSACLTIGTPSASDMFVLAAEDTVSGLQTPASKSFVPQDAPGWVVTFDSLGANPVGPVASPNACSLARTGP
jgi:hypothetical protein